MARDGPILLDWATDQDISARQTWTCWSNLAAHLPLGRASVPSDAVIVTLTPRIASWILNPKIPKNLGVSILGRFPAQGLLLNPSWKSSFPQGGHPFFSLSLHLRQFRRLGRGCWMISQRKDQKSKNSWGFWVSKGVFVYVNITNINTNINIPRVFRAPPNLHDFHSEGK